MPLALFLFSFSWSLAPDLRFSLGQTNMLHRFRYTNFATQAGARILIDLNLFFSVRERVVSSESCILIGSGSGQNFPISDHGHGNRVKTIE